MEQLKGIVMGANSVEMVRDTYDRSSPAEADTWPLIEMNMDRLDWEFVIDCLRFRARNGTGADTVERATFTADTMQDVLGSL